jgi:hypothetical protein
MLHFGWTICIGQGGASTPVPLDVQKRLELAEKEEHVPGELPYRQIVGSLMYAMLATRPDLAPALSIVSKYLEKPKPTHIKLVQHILQYLKANPNLSLHYQSRGPIELTCFADASYANDEQYKSRSRYCYLIGDSLVSWYSGTQSVIAQSSAEAEFYAAVSAANECLWMKQLLKELGFEREKAPIFEDNQAFLALTKNPADYKRTKHTSLFVLGNHSLRFGTKNNSSKSSSVGIDSPNAVRVFNSDEAEGRKMRRHL